MGARSSATDLGSLKRVDAVVLHADLVDYSRHLADDPTATIATVDRYRSHVAEAVEKVGGRLHDFVGDSFLAVFSDARSAMAAATGICSAIRSDAGPVDLQFRMGLASGEVILSERGDIFGDPVTIAARIQSITDRGGINVSERVFLELDEPELRLRPLGPHQLKNVPGLVRVYRLETAGTTPADLHEQGDPTITVLPVTSHPDLAHVAHAIRMDMLTAMVRLPGLEVLDFEHVSSAGTASRSARYLVQAGILGSGQKLRVYAQLLDTPTINRVWAHRWDGAVDEIFELQDRITHDVVRAVEVELVIGAPAHIYRSSIEPSLVERVYRGWHELGKGTAVGLQNALELFELVHEEEPNAPTGAALSAFAHWYGTLAGLSSEPDRDLEMARVRAEEGMAIGDPTGLCQMVRAALVLYDGGDLDAALVDARASLELRPTCDVTHGVEASIERYRGNWELATVAAQRAIALSPTRKPWYEVTLAGAYYAGGLFQEAADTAEPIATTRANLEASLVLAAAQQALGLERRARATVSAIRTQFPDARRADLGRSHPFQDPSLLERWLGDLEAAGMP